MAFVGKHSMASHISHHDQCAIQCCTHLPAQCSDKLYTNHRQSGEAQSQLSAASAALEAAQVEVTQLKALAAERQKRFVMLNGTFKKKEDGLRDRADNAEQQMAEAQAVAEAARAEAANAVQVRLQPVVLHSAVCGRAHQGRPPGFAAYTRHSARMQCHCNAS